jgi:PST family polysaccharide transporter
VDWRVFSDFLGWISLSQILLAINWQSDQLLLGKLMRPAQLGLFSNANNITYIPMAALFSPILRPLLSAFTMVRHDPERLRNSYQSAASAVVTIGLPLLVGQSIVASPTVHVLLGSKWVGAIPMVHWLSLSLIPTLFGVLMSSLCMALNNTRQMVWQNLLYMGVKLPCVIVGAIMFGFMGVIGARLISESVDAIYCMLVVRRMIGASVRSQLLNCRRSVISAIIMAGLLEVCAPWLDFGMGPWGQLAQLIATVMVGAAVYTSSLLFLWRWEGKPPGIEAIALRMAGDVLKRVKRAPLERKIV